MAKIGSEEESMDVQLQELIDRIKSEGVASAEKQAAVIVEEAEKKAQAIIAEAEEKANAVIEDAKKKRNKPYVPGKTHLHRRVGTSSSTFRRDSRHSSMPL
jgi:cell division septum initiation protein DivIVA